MNAVVFIIFIIAFLSIVTFLLAALVGSKPFDCLILLEELAREHQGRICSLTCGRSAVELPLSFGSMLVGVWYRSMLGTSRTSPRATISIQSTSFQDLPEFMINSKFTLSCGGVSGFKKASCTNSSIDPKFKQKWCIFVRPETSDHEVDTLLRLLNSPLTNLHRQAVSPQHAIVNISYRDGKIDFVYSNPIHTIDRLETLMKASVEFGQDLARV